MAILCWAAKNSLRGTNVLIGPLRAELRLFRVVLRLRGMKKIFKIATCQRRRRIRQQIASVCAAYGSTLLAQTAHAVAKTIGYTRRTRISVLQTSHAVALCQRMRLQIASVDGAYGSNLLAYAVHAVANCQHRRRIRQQFASVHGACGSKTV